MERQDQAYPECRHIPKATRPELTDEEVLKLPSNDNEFLPLYERKISNCKRERQCSLITNERLHCRWESYIRNIEEMERIPLKFPIIRHLHFHTYNVKYLPSETPTTWKTYRMRLKLGPGIDYWGQMPIPNDLCLYR